MQSVDVCAYMRPKSLLILVKINGYLQDKQSENNILASYKFIFFIHKPLHAKKTLFIHWWDG
jgi:hypothetical protein